MSYQEGRKEGGMKMQRSGSRQSPQRGLPGSGPWLANRHGDVSTVQVQLDYSYTFLLGKALGLGPRTLQGESSMVVL